MLPPVPDNLTHPLPPRPQSPINRRDPAEPTNSIIWLPENKAVPWPGGERKTPPLPAGPLPRLVDKRRDKPLGVENAAQQVQAEVMQGTYDGAERDELELTEFSESPLSEALIWDPTADAGMQEHEPFDADRDDFDAATLDGRSLVFDAFNEDDDLFDFPALDGDTLLACAPDTSPASADLELFGIKDSDMLDAFPSHSAFPSFHSNPPDRPWDVFADRSSRVAEALKEAREHLFDLQTSHAQLKDLVGQLEGVIEGLSALGVEDGETWHAAWRELRDGEEELFRVCREVRLWVQKTGELERELGLEIGG